MVKPEIKGNVNFEIKSQFMRELREDTFSGNKNEDVHDHVDRVLNIELSTLGTSLKKPLSKGIFHHPRPLNNLKISGVSQDAVLLRVFSFTLTGSAKRWVDRLTPGPVNTWDLLISKGFVHHPRPLNDLKTSITSNRKALNHYTKLGNVKQVDEVKYGEFRLPAPLNGSNGAKFRVGLQGFGEVSETAKDNILRDHWRKRFRNKYDDNEDFKDPDGCGESKENEILGTVINKLHDEWFKGTDEDDDDLEGIIDYRKPTLYDEFIDLDDEEYKERKFRLLGMPYVKPPPILIEKVNVTRYSIGPGEVYTKMKVSEVEELSRTRGNIANIRARIMEEILGNDDEKKSYDKM
nr:hypothetical protein [Tanacetum cinerariifolium]